MKIGIVGNCMAAGVGMALRQINEDVHVVAFEAREVALANKIDIIADELLSCDAVLAQDLPADYRRLKLSELRKEHSNVHRLPAIAFTGFHPDCIYLQKDGKQYGSPVDVYHSAIVCASYSAKYSTDEALSLFEPDVFRKLGYFSEYDKACLFLSNEFARCEIEFDNSCEQLLRRGAFMHTINHPNGSFVISVASLIAKNLGIYRKQADGLALAHDVLSNNTIWPVYPAIASHIGIQGSYLFKRPGGPNLVTGEGVFYSLPEFIEASFTMYRNVPDEVFQIPTVARVRSILFDKPSEIDK